MKTTTTTTKTTSIRLVLLFAVLLVSSFSMSAQSTIATAALTNTNEVEVTIATENVSSNSTMSFVSWFMGTKQTTNANNSSDVSSNSKKQMINSGIAPNRLLVKSFLKKASSYTNTLA